MSAIFYYPIEFSKQVSLFSELNYSKFRYCISLLFTNIKYIWIKSPKQKREFFICKEFPFIYFHNLLSTTSNLFLLKFVQMPPFLHKRPLHIFLLMVLLKIYKQARPFAPLILLHQNI